MHLRALASLPRTLLPMLVGIAPCALLCPPARAAEEPSASVIKAAADRWIELEARAADERNDWRAQKEVLTTSIDVLEKERTSLRSRVEANDLASGMFRNRVENARAALAAQEAAHAGLNQACTEVEGRLRALVPRLPEPLQERLRLSLDRLANATAAAPLSVSERTQLVVSALTTIDQFNNSLTITHHLRPNGSGATIDVKVLYWGLAMAYGIDAQGRHAWVLRPGPTGWEWTDATAQVDDIKVLFAVQERKDNPRLVVLPVAAKGGAQ